MARLSTRNQKGSRRVRIKADDVKGLSITSLLDVLTIILVFLIKNVSMEAVRISQLPDMRYPTTMVTEELMENALVTPVKLYLDRVLMGLENQRLGTPQELVESSATRAVMQEFFNREFSDIPEDKQKDACLVVQADSDLPCLFITEIVRVGTSVGYENIYFATLEDAEWLRTFGSASTQ